MSKYSEIFLVGGAEYEELGSHLRVRKYGSWLAEESWVKEDQSRDRAQFTLKAIQLARRIAKEKDIPEEEAFQLLQGGRGENSIYLNEFSEETADLMACMPSYREQFEQLATVFLRNRGEVLSGKKWLATEDWEKGDTAKLTMEMMQNLELFMAKEDNSQIDNEPTEDEDSGEEAEASPKD
jgi:hypothetical protein